MSVGYADDEDVDAVTGGDAAIGSPSDDLDQLMDDALPETNAADIDLIGEQDPQQGDAASGGPHTPAPTGSTPAPATDAYPTAPQFPELGPPPPPPAFSGDPQKDVALNAQWQRDLTAHHAELTKRQTALAEHAARVGELRGKKEAEVAAVEAREKKAEIARAAADRKARQDQIHAAVADRLAAAKDIEGFKWDRPHTGKEIASIIFGALSAGLQNAAAAQLGQVGNAQNEAIKGIQKRMDREFEAKKLKLKGAGDALLMAKYDAKTGEDAHRAAMNDLNADFAARYKAIANEAEAALRRAGVSVEQAKGNALVVNAAQEAAKHEGDIHNREEGHRDQRRQAEATLALARANLGERRREFEERKTQGGKIGTEAETKSANYNLYKEHADWIASNAASLTPQDRERITAIVKSGRLGQIAEAGGALIGLDKEKGMSSKAKEYLGHMREAADAYGRLKSGGAINADEEARFMDQFVVKPSDKPEDVKARAANIRQNVRVLSTLDKTGGSQAGTVSPPAAERPPAPGGGGGPKSSKDQQAATLVDRLMSVPDDPRADAMRKWLKDNGYKVPAAPAKKRR